MCPEVILFDHLTAIFVSIGQTTSAIADQRSYGWLGDGFLCSTCNTIDLLLMTLKTISGHRIII